MSALPLASNRVSQLWILLPIKRYFLTDLFKYLIFPYFVSVLVFNVDFTWEPSPMPMAIDVTYIGTFKHIKKLMTNLSSMMVSIRFNGREPRLFTYLFSRAQNGSWRNALIWWRSINIVRFVFGEQCATSEVIFMWYLFACYKHVKYVFFWNGLIVSDYFILGVYCLFSLRSHMKCNVDIPLTSGQRSLILRNCQKFASENAVNDDILLFVLNMKSAVFQWHSAEVGVGGMAQW